MRRMALWLLLALALAGCRQEDDGSTAEDMVANVVTTEKPSPPAGPSEQPAATKGFWDTATPTPDGGPATGAFWPTASPAATATGAATATPTAVGEVSPTPTPPSPVACGGRPAGWKAQLILPGDTVGALAACVGASVDEVLAANCLTANDTIFAGGTLWLPVACATPSPTKEAGILNIPPTTPVVTPVRTPPGLVVVLPTPPPPQPGGSCIRPGYEIQLSLSGFPANSPVDIMCTDSNGNACALSNPSVTTDESGVAQVVRRLPAEMPIGLATITAQSSTDLSIMATFVVDIPGDPWQMWCTPTPVATSPTTDTPTATATPTVTTTATATATVTPTATVTATATAAPLPELAVSTPDAPPAQP